MQHQPSFQTLHFLVLSILAPRKEAIPEAGRIPQDNVSQSVSKEEKTRSLMLEMSVSKKKKKKLISLSAASH